MLSIGHQVVLQLGQFPLHLGQTLLVLPDALVNGTLDLCVALLHGYSHVLAMPALVLAAVLVLLLQCVQSLFQHYHGAIDSHHLFRVIVTLGSDQ